MRRKILIVLTLVLIMVASMSLVACGGDVNPPETYDALKSEPSEMATGANLRIMSYNLLVEAWGGSNKALDKKHSIKSRSAQVVAMIDHYKPDVIGTQEMCEQWHMNLPGAIKEHYACIFNNLFHYTSMIYNRDTLDLVEKGRIKYDERTEGKMRNASWALFKRKSDSKEFIVLNTHFDFGNNRAIQVKQMKQYDTIARDLQTKYKVPVFLTGDYNVLEKLPVAPDKDNGIEGDWNYDSHPGVDLYNDFVGYTNFIDSNYIKGIATRDGKYLKWDAPKWDHIFVSREVSVKSFTVLSDEYYKSISDHFPIFIDVAI